MAAADKTDTEPAEEKPRRTTYCWRATRQFLGNRFPSFKWLPQYKWKEYFLPDFVAGITLACLHVPQSLAFAVIAGASPIFGLYTSCFAVFIYCFLGNAHISSVGPVAVASILTGDAVAKYSGEEYSNDEIVITVTFIVGIMYTCAYLLRFGIITLIFTAALKSAFLLACTVTIMTKAVYMLLGLILPEARGFFIFPITLYRICQHITETNLVTLGLSISVLVLFFFNTFVLRPLMAKKTKFILPIEAIVTALAIVISYTIGLKDHGVVIIGTVPSGLPSPMLPAYPAIGDITMPTLVVAITNFCTSLTVLTSFNEGLDPQQELFALGVTNIICCHFGSLPFGNSMMRTAVAVTLGLKTLMASIVSSLLLFFVILWAGPLFEPLPKAVLGCIIIYGIGMLVPTLVRQSQKVFYSGKENIFIWITVFCTGLFIDITTGLFVGMAFTFRQNLAAQIPATVKKEEAQNLPEQQELLSKGKPKTPA